MPWIRVEEGSGPDQRGVRNDGLTFLVGAVFASGLLSMVATWFFVNHYPVPDDDAIHYGLLGFFFVAVFVLCLAGWVLAESKLRKGQRIPAIKRIVSLILVGLLVASVVGSLPWLWSRLIAVLPWMRDIPWFLLLVSLSYYPWRLRKLTEDHRRQSRKGLMFQGALLLFFVSSTLFSAVSLFADGKAWLGALYLAMALLFGFLAGAVFVELRRIWRTRPEKPHESIA